MSQPKLNKIKTLNKTEKMIKEANGMAVGAGFGRCEELVLVQMDKNKSFKKEAQKTGETILHARDMSQSKEAGNSSFDINN